MRHAAASDETAHSYACDSAGDDCEFVRLKGRVDLIPCGTWTDGDGLLVFGQLDIVESRDVDHDAIWTGTTDTRTGVVSCSSNGELALEVFDQSKSNGDLHVVLGI